MNSYNDIDVLVQKLNTIVTHHSHIYNRFMINPESDKILLPEILRRLHLIYSGSLTLANGKEYCFSITGNGYIICIWLDMGEKADSDKQYEIRDLLAELGFASGIWQEKETGLQRLSIWRAVSPEFETALKILERRWSESRKIEC